jgi:rod shape-determining protein MreD
VKFPLSQLPLKVSQRSLHRSVAKPTLTPWEWIFFPALLCILVTLILAAPIKIGVFSLPEPILPLVLAFSWGLIRPSYIAPVVLAGLGLFLDYFWGGPLGLYTFLLMLVYATFTALRAYVSGQDTLIIIGVYILTCFVFFAVGTIIVSITSGTVPRIIGVFEQFFATLACFPLVLHMLETYLHSDTRFQ